MCAEVCCVPYIEVVIVFCVALVLACWLSTYTSGLASSGTLVFGIVMLQKPIVPFGPVIVKSTVAIFVWFDVIKALDICELLTFPLTERSTIAPLPSVTGIVVAVGVGLGDVIFVGVGVGIEVGVGVGVGDGDEVGIAVGVSVGVIVGVGVGVGG